MKLKSIFLYVILTCFIILLLIGYVQSKMNYSQCNNDCQNTEGCLVVETIHSGDYGLNDYCILYFEDSIKVYQLNTGG